MKWSRATVLAAFAIIAGSHAASAQAPAQCNAFMALRNEAQQKAMAVRAATEHKAERKEVCALVTAFRDSRGGRGEIPRREQDLVRRSR